MADKFVTVSVKPETHEALTEIKESTGLPIFKIVDDMVELFKRQKMTVPTLPHPEGAVPVPVVEIPQVTDCAHVHRMPHYVQNPLNTGPIVDAGDDICTRCWGIVPRNG